MKSSPHKIKVLIVIPFLHQGGTQRQVSYLFENIDRDRFDLHLGYFIKEDVFYRDLIQDPTHAHLFGKGKIVTFFSWLAFIRKTRELKPDIVHSYMQSANILAGFAHYFFSRIPLIFSVGMSKQPKWHYSFYRFLRKRPSLTICNSRKIREELIGLSGVSEDKVLVVPNPLDTNKFAPCEAAQRQRAREAQGFSSGDFVLASVGRFSHQKNQIGTVHALKILKHRGSLPANLKMIFIGKSMKMDYEAQFRRLIQEFGLEEICLFRPPLQDIVSFYHAVDGVFQPSHHEGLSNVVIECQSAGTPVALSREGDNDELVRDGETGISFSLKSHEDTASGLMRLIELCLDPGKKARVAKRAREEVCKRFSMREAMGLRQEIYDTLADETTPLASPLPCSGDSIAGRPTLK